MRLTSDKTTLHRLRPADLSAFQTYRSDPDVARYQNWEPMTDAEATEFLTFMTTTTPIMRPSHWAQIAISDTVTDALIGDMGLYLSQDGAEAELGITLASSHHGHGHATRAAKLASLFLFDETEISHINAYADLRNLPSRALMTRVGFMQTGTEIMDGIDVVIFILHRP